MTNPKATGITEPVSTRVFKRRNSWLSNTTIRDLRFGRWNLGFKLRLVLVLLLPALLLTFQSKADPDPAAQPRMAARTNLTAKPGLARTNAILATKQAPGKTNVAAGSQGFFSRTKTQTMDSFHRLQGTRAFYPVVIGVPICLVLAGIFLFKSVKTKSRRAQSAASELQAPSIVSRRAKKLARVHSCNILQIGAEARHLWQFEAQDGGFSLNRQLTSLPGEGLPSRLVVKSWRALFQPKLNVAWLPADQVFLRVAQFPRSDFNETLAMVELQLEKLSPIPVAQIAWSIHILPHTNDALQTVIVMIVARNVIEEFLGQLESQGYLADRLELSLLDQLQATPIVEDGAWIYPQVKDGKSTALVAWWYGGVLQNVDLATMPAIPTPSGVKEQFLQMAWAGEMEGWLKAPPRWHLVADQTTAAQWEPVLRQGLEQPVALAQPVAPAELAGLTARRTAHSDTRATLLPEEFSTRYQQQFHDRLWMRGLLAVAGLYLLGVAIYGVALGFAAFRTRGVEKQASALGPQYTNTIQLKQRYQVLKDRQELKFAALECWNLTARYLPDSHTLDNLNFVDGKKLALAGTSPAEQRKDVIDFESDLRKATTTNGDLMFDPSKGEHVSYQVQGSNVRWNFTLELKRVEIE